MNCPKCGKELNENQKFCSECGAKIGENDMQEIINIKWLVISIAAIALVFGTCILATQNSPSANTSNNNVNNEVVEDTNTDEETTAYTEEPQEVQKPVAPKPNCVYETSDGVCFTTQIFEFEPIKVQTQTSYEYNYWLGAKDACESKGYKLPNDYELRSLFGDILGIEIYSGIDIDTTKFSYTKIPTNYEILKRIAPKKEMYGIYLWENEEFDDERAYMRKKDTIWGDETTKQYVADKFSYNKNVICVYDPNGKPHKSLLEISREKEAKAKELQAKQRALKEKQMQEELNKEAEDALF